MNTLIPCLVTWGYASDERLVPKWQSVHLDLRLPSIFTIFYLTRRQRGVIINIMKSVTLLLIILCGSCSNTPRHLQSDFVPNFVPHSNNYKIVLDMGDALRYNMDNEIIT